MRNKRIAAWFVFCLLLAAAPLIQGGPPFFSLTEVKPGQKGLGYTVPYGTEVKDFAVEILGVIQNKAKNRNFILVKVSGNIFRETKGIAAGMSGSPVFIDGRLAGAISYAFDRADPQYGLVTPVEDMLRLWERDYRGGPLALAPSPLLPFAGATAFPVLTPLLVSGSRVPPELEQTAGRFGLKLVTAVETLGYDARTAPKLQPGSAVAAAFSLGDYNAVAIGTVTWLDGKRFLAFGHPVANLGAVDYPATGAFIHRVIASTEMPFKIGVPLGSVGRFVQDRGAGASGVREEAADTVLVKAVVQDKDSGNRGTYQSAVASAPSLLRGMALAALLDAMDQTLDQYAAGSARVTLRIEGEGLERTLVRRNLFQDGKDVAAAALSEVGEAIDLIVQNEFQPIRLRSIVLEVSFSPSPLSATVLKARADRGQVRPGERVKVDVELRPFRGAPYTVPFTVTVPENAAAGKLMLSIRGGLSRNREEQEGKQASFADLFTKKPGSLEEHISAFVDRPHNNDLILEYLPFTRDEGDEDMDREPIVLIQGCDFVVMGETQVTLDVQAASATEQEKAG
ncbi:MAG: SpoIVB peptidase S55 domain-containing protein [Bacteroidota bacterium]